MWGNILRNTYDKLPETGYWGLGRFITIIVVVSIVLIVRQEDPDKMQDARGLQKSIGLQTPIYHIRPIGVKNAITFGF